MLPLFSDQLPGRIVRTASDKECLWSGGTDYLGMGWNEEFRRYLTEGFKRYGSHYGSSRNNSLQLNVYQEAETALAQFTSAPSALTVSSGMWAGQLVMKEIENIATNSEAVQSPLPVQYHYSPKAHPALWGNKYSASSSTWLDWAVTTVQAIRHSLPNSVHIICTDSVGSPFIEAYDFNVFDNLPEERNIWLVTDDSHGLGVSGNSGSGIFEKVSLLDNVNSIVTASLNKAMGIPAGVILASQNVTEALRKSPWFSGASPCAPAYCYAMKKFIQSESYQKALAVLQFNIRYFRDRISTLAIFTKIEAYPVFCSVNADLYAYLLDSGIMASCFSYPSPADLPITRIVITALHQKNDLDYLAEVCIKFNSAV